MAHPAQQQFCREVCERFPEKFQGQAVLEIGSRNVNGSLRELFRDCRYTGVDCAPGPDVDVVCLGHEFRGEPDSFDVVCCAETFEHDPHAAATLAHMLRLLKPGGLFFMTCAAPDRREHGTRRTGKHYGPDPHFYRNVEPGVFLEWLLAAGTRFGQLLLRHDRASGDLYFWLCKE